MNSLAHLADWIIGFSLMAGLFLFIYYAITQYIHGVAGVVGGLVMAGIGLYVLWTSLGDGSWVPHTSGISLILFMFAVAVITFAIMQIEMVHRSWVATAITIAGALVMIVASIAQLSRVGVVPPPVALHATATKVATTAVTHLPPVPAPSTVITSPAPGPSTTSQVANTKTPSGYTAAECDRATKSGASPKFLADHGCKATSSSVRTSTKSATPTVRYTTAECGYAQNAGASPKFLADHGCQ